MGGTDDPSNLVELTIEEHAEAHRKLFEQHGHWEDEIAWKGLAKMIDRAEIISFTISKNNSTRQKGSGNSQYGTTWCVTEDAIDCSKRKRFPKDSIPNGWISTKEFKQRKLKSKQSLKHQQIISKHSEWYRLYCAHGFDEFVKKTNYQYTQQNLVQQFAKWVPEFKPQNGKKRQTGRAGG